MALKQVFVLALTDVVADAAPVQDSLGDIRIEAGKIYKYVKYSGTTTVAAGDAVCYVATDTSNQTVDGANTANGAGVAMAAVASGSVQRGYIQIGGVATLSTALAGSPAVGDDVSVNGASAPAVTKKTTANAQTFGTVVHVTNKIVDLALPW